MLRLLTIISIFLSSLNLSAQKWTASSFDVSVSSIYFNNDIQESLKREFINYYEFENKFNHEEAKKSKMISNYNHFGQTCANFNYVLKKNTRFLFFKNALLTSGINLNFWNSVHNEFIMESKSMLNDSTVKSTNNYKITNLETRKGLGFNLGLSLLSKPFLKRLKLQIGMINIFCPMTLVKYIEPRIQAEEYSDGKQYRYYNPEVEAYKSSGKLMNHTQLKIGLRCNVDCTGNLFLNYIGNFSIYKGKPDIEYTGFSQGIEFGINFLLTNEERSLETNGSFW